LEAWVLYDNPLRAVLRAFGPASVWLDGHVLLFHLPIPSRSREAGSRSEQYNSHARV
jgi:hypothetical protein